MMFADKKTLIVWLIVNLTVHAPPTVDELERIKKSEKY
jgi:hypothetical protein